MTIISLLLLLCSSVQATLGQYARVERGTTLRDAYDFLIVGGGTSGLTVADRLTENPNVTVLVIEYGPLDKHEPSVLVPGLQNLSDTPYWVDITCEPQRGLNNGTFEVPSPAVVGGGTVINGMVFDRGGAPDYDAWERLGNPGWGWADLLPYFKKSENYTPTPESYAAEWGITWDLDDHGSRGPVQSSYPVFQFPSIKNFFEAWHSLGISTPKDPEGGEKAGVFWVPGSLDPKDETRSYARTAHYDRVIAMRPNYHLLTNNTVTKIILRNNTAVGVEYMPTGAGQVSTVKASKEVIMAAGSIHTPQLLQLSGIGSKELLEGLDIQTLVDLPGVGYNLQDHPTLFTSWNYTTNIFPNADELTSNKTYANESLALYYAARQGPYTIVHTGGNTVAFLPLHNITDSSTFAAIISSARSLNTSTIYPPSTTHPTIFAGYAAQKEAMADLYDSALTSVQETGFSSGALLPISLVKPLSRGTVLINTSDPLAQPLIDYGALLAPSDVAIVIAALRANRAMMRAPGMAQLGPTETLPGANLTDDAELEVALRKQMNPANAHQCCTCAMLSREHGGVVDAELLVYGVKGLRIVDASVMPMIVASHTSSTVYAVAEKAGDLIKRSHGLRS